MPQDYAGSPKIAKKSKNSLKLGVYTKQTMRELAMLKALYDSHDAEKRRFFACAIGFIQEEGETHSPLTLPALIMEREKQDLETFNRKQFKEPVNVTSDFATLQRKHKIKIFEQLIEAVAHLHQLKIYHMDIKPDNFLCNSIDLNCYDKFCVKLCDFGMSHSDKWCRENIRLGFLPFNVDDETTLKEKQEEWDETFTQNGKRTDTLEYVLDPNSTPSEKEKKYLNERSAYFGGTLMYLPHQRLAMKPSFLKKRDQWALGLTICHTAYYDLPYMQAGDNDNKMPTDEEYIEFLCKLKAIQEKNDPNEYFVKVICYERNFLAELLMRKLVCENPIDMQKIRCFIQSQCWKIQTDCWTKLGISSNLESLFPEFQWSDSTGPCHPPCASHQHPDQTQTPHCTSSRTPHCTSSGTPQGTLPETPPGTLPETPPETTRGSKRTHENMERTT